MKKICVVSGARSDYGLLRWLMEEIENSKKYQLQIIVTGSHLSPEFGLTYKEIINDGFTIDKKIDMLLSSESISSLGKSIGLCALGMSDAISELQPDLIVVLGDRYELLPIVSISLMFRIPIAHISGGDITEGAIDNEIRNAVTMMSNLHFPGNEESAGRIRKMGIRKECVFNVGEPGIDNFNRLKLMDRGLLAENLGIDIHKKWVLLTYHPETYLSLDENISTAINILESLLKYNELFIVATFANADNGGKQINNLLTKYGNNNQDRIRVIDSLGQLRYLSFMKEAFLVIGNSSSGVVEAPHLGIPVINVGNRQNGRYLCQNVISTSNKQNDITSEIEKIVTAKKKNQKSYTYYGDGYSSKKIFSHIDNFLTGEDFE